MEIKVIIVKARLTISDILKKELITVNLWLKLKLFISVLAYVDISQGRTIYVIKLYDKVD